MRPGLAIPVLMMVTLLTIDACQTIHAPKGSVPKRRKLEYDAFGGYAQLETKDNSKYEGELIGVRNDSIIILNGKAVSLAKADVAKASVIMYNPNEYAIGYLSIIATISNGGFLIFTGPLWLIATTAAIENEGVANYEKYPEAVRRSPDNNVPVSAAEAWVRILKYSRFPQGVPDQLHLADLKERPKDSFN